MFAKFKGSNDLITKKVKLGNNSGFEVFIKDGFHYLNVSDSFENKPQPISGALYAQLIKELGGK